MIDPAFFQENERTAPAETGRKIVGVGSLACEKGGQLEAVEVAYETWGELNSAKDNAILIQHALSGDSHAIGWWDRLIGPGKAMDTDRFFVVGHNALGGCQGTTGPASPAPDGKPYQSRFPAVTVGDMVTVQERLLDHLGIDRALCTAGGSMGGMMALELARRNRSRKAFLTATCAAHGAMQIGFNEAARQAVMRDPKWRGGDYGDDPPEMGLAVGRMIGHLSYLSSAAFDAKFGRNRQDGKEQFQVESYLNYQGDKFTKRFDANTLIVLSNAIDSYECTSLEDCLAEFLIVSYTSDWLYTPTQSQELLRLALEAGCSAEWHNVDLPWGHDSFLLDGDLQAAPLRRFLAEA